MAKHNSLDDINFRGGAFVPPGLPGPVRTPRIKESETVKPPQTQPIPKESPSPSYRTSQKQKTMPTTKPLKASHKDKTATQTKGKAKGMKRGTATKVAGIARGLGPSFRSPEDLKPRDNEDAPGKSLPAGEIPYLDGPRLNLPSEKFTGIHELDQLDQTQGDWAGKPSQIRTLYQSINIQAYPQYGGREASANTTGATSLVGVSQTQDQVFLDHYSNIVDYYSRKYTVNKSFEDNFTIDNFYLYLYDNSKVLGELLCLLQRAAYYQSGKANYTENASVEKVANVLNTTNFYPIRNKLARAIKRQYFSREMMNEMMMLLQTYRLTPHQTGGTCFYVTDEMYELLEGLGDATTEALADTAITTYIDRVETWADYILYGRPIRDANSENKNQPRRNVNGTNYPLFSDASPGNIYSGLTVAKRNAIGAILAKVSGDMGPFDYVKCNNIPQGNSQSEYDPAFCDRFNNGLAVSDDGFYPPMLRGDTAAAKPALAESAYFASERDWNNQDERTAFHMLMNVAGEAPIFYDVSRKSHSRKYLSYRGRNLGVTSEEKDLAYTSNEIRVVVNNNTYPPVQDNFVTKLYSTTASGTRYYATMPDGDASALFFLTYANMVEQFKKRYIVNM